MDLNWSRREKHSSRVSSPAAPSGEASEIQWLQEKLHLRVISQIMISGGGIAVNWASF